MRRGRGIIKYDVAILVLEEPVDFTNPRLGHIRWSLLLFFCSERVMRIMFRPLCLPDEDDLTLDLPAERTGTALGLGLETVLYEHTSCDYVQGVSVDNSFPSKLKKIKLKY